MNVNIEETSDGNITLTAYPFEPEDETDDLPTIQHLQHNQYEVKMDSIAKRQLKRNCLVSYSQ